uniref:S100/CaBP-9k-type calcium binding subdomain domain-containing protein n=1 Tax=Prolemur simus TaxID=1328070 RepID=A0A8C9DGI1_PROSS
MSTVLENISSIIDIFHQYSKKDKDTETLSKKELKELLETQFQPILKEWLQTLWVSTTGQSQSWTV